MSVEKDVSVGRKEAFLFHSHLALRVDLKDVLLECEGLSRIREGNPFRGERKAGCA